MVRPWTTARATLPGLILAALLASGARAADPAAAGARQGLDLARAAAAAWAEDAMLVYVENDEALDAAGAAPRWGYLFSSRRLGISRAYSVRGGRIVQAENLDIKFEAPPLSDPWIDSGPALAAAEREAGARFRREHQGALATMLLVRGALESSEPDETTWMLVYTAPSAPSLFVVVEAAAGRVRRTWRG
jgi:hypothetical protein